MIGNPEGFLPVIKGFMDTRHCIVVAPVYRNTDYTNFPPTITLVGEYDPFRDDTIAYVEALQKEGIPVTFKFYKGCFHGFEVAGSQAAIAKDALHFMFNSFAEYYDAYL